MYQKNNRYYGSRQGSPQRNGRQGFQRGRGGNGFGARVQRSLPNDPALFTRKAVQTTTNEEYVVRNSFASFNFTPALQTNIDYKKYATPTPIQDQTIGHILAGRDVIGLAATGTGKTAAFLIPLIQKMHEDPGKKALIITPTRELAVQIQEEFRDFAYNMKLYSSLLIGGTNMGRQIHELRYNPNVVIATPGRLKDLVKQQFIHLDQYSNIVLDEVDLMVDIGFIADIKFFISLMTKTKQSLFFSATISPKVQDILHAFVHDPVTVSVKKQETSENVDQDVVRVSNPAEKIETLHSLLIKDGFDKVLIFGRTKHGIEKLNKQLDVRGFKVGALHGNKKQNQRQRVLESFKQNKIKILLATDVASRGLDIDNVTHVINYDLPETYDDYIHRIGRTGRAGKTGIALTFI